MRGPRACVPPKPDLACVMWHTVRGPFHRMCCASDARHRWERFDYDRAGCLLCGQLHRCASNSVDNKCVLETCDDGSVCCTVTGFCVPVLRYCASEYVDTCDRPMDFVDSGTDAHSLHVDRLFSCVRSAITDFLTGSRRRSMCAWRVDVVRDAIRGAFAHECARTDKGTGRRRVVCMQTTLARVLSHEDGCVYAVGSRALVDTCVENATRCLVELGMVDIQPARIDSLAIGMMYLMVKGVSCNNVPWLVPVPELRDVLPPVCMLTRWYGFSSKLLCNTENELKLAIRRREGML